MGATENVADFGDKTIAVDTHLDSRNYSGQIGLKESDPTKFKGKIFDTGGNYKMKIDGAFFKNGPNNVPREMGGSVRIKGPDYKAGGIFAASQVPNVTTGRPRN
jgi:hypothetical protein